MVIVTNTGIDVLVTSVFVKQTYAII